MMNTMKSKRLDKVKRLEYNAHIYAFTPLGTFYYENYKIEKSEFFDRYGEVINDQW